MLDLSDVPVVQSPPANAGDMGSTPVQEDLTYLGITTPLRGDY